MAETQIMKAIKGMSKSDKITLQVMGCVVFLLVVAALFRVHVWEPHAHADVWVPVVEYTAAGLGLLLSVTMVAQPLGIWLINKVASVLPSLLPKKWRGEG